MTQVSAPPLRAEDCVVRGTHAGKGRIRFVSPGRTAARHLHYGRIFLDADLPSVSFATGDQETGFICLGGSALITTPEQTFELGRYDALYVPRDTAVVVKAGQDGCDVAEIAAAVSGRYPTQLVRFADVQRDSSLHFMAGAPPAERKLNVLLGKNVQAGRIMAGVTFSSPGNWTSWPPHEHGAMLEEAYLFIDMPAPGFGIQMVYTDAQTPEIAAIVREGDIVLIPRGYHPNVAAPGGTINFLWMMAAERETVDRQFGVVNVQPEFAAIPSGLQPKPASPLAALHQDWSRTPVERLPDGVERQMVVGQDLMICRLRFPPHTVTADHRHPHEQMTLVEKGHVRFTFGDETREARAGDVLFFPSNFWHGARILDEETVLVDIFSPVREDFLKEGDAARG